MGGGELVPLLLCGALWFWNKSSEVPGQHKAKPCRPHGCSDFGPFLLLCNALVFPCTAGVLLRLSVKLRKYNWNDILISIQGLRNAHYISCKSYHPSSHCCQTGFLWPQHFQYHRSWPPPGLHFLYVLLNLMFHLSHPLQNSLGLCLPNTLAQQRLENRPRGEMISMAGLEMSYSMTDWAGVTRGCCWGVDTRSRESKPPCDCRHPPTLLTEEHASGGLSVRKTFPFPQWISAHLCPKTVPHAFLCMWTWQSSANHQQDVSFAFPMWWAIPTFTHFPCKNRTSPWLVRIRDVAVAKEKFSSVEVNPQGGLNPQSRVSSTVFWGQSP